MSGLQSLYDGLAAASIAQAIINMDGAYLVQDVQVHDDDEAARISKLVAKMLKAEGYTGDYTLRFIEQ